MRFGFLYRLFCLLVLIRCESIFEMFGEKTEGMKQRILGLSKDKLKSLFAPENGIFSLENGIKQQKNHLLHKQVFHALYRKGSKTFGEMTSISKENRRLLDENFDLGFGRVERDLVSKDGTEKHLSIFDETKPNFLVESVFIPNVNGNGSMPSSVGTVCVSSQIGCSLSCSFCLTGSKKFLKNLAPSEIIAQVMLAMRHDFPYDISGKRPRRLTNIVYMGMGEPLLNFRNVAKAVKFINETFNLSPSRTTISTSGIVPLMRAVGNELGAGLAVSLHAVTDDLRDQLVPINKQYPIKYLMDGCKQYLDGIQDRAKSQKRITFEYVMLDKVNDSEQEARELARLLSKIPSHVNLIPFNPWPGSLYKT